MMCIVIIAQYADCTPCGFGSRQKVRSVVHPRAAILHFDLLMFPVKGKAWSRGCPSIMSFASCRMGMFFEGTLSEALKREPTKQKGLFGPPRHPSGKKQDPQNKGRTCSGPRCVPRKMINLPPLLPNLPPRAGYPGSRCAGPKKRGAWLGEFNFSNVEAWDLS